MDSEPARSSRYQQFGWAFGLLLVTALFAAIANGLYVESGRPALFGKVGRAQPVDDCSGWRVATCDVTLYDNRGEVVDTTGTLHAGIPPDASDTVRARYRDGNAIPDNLLMRVGAVAWVAAMALVAILALGGTLGLFGVFRGSVWIRVSVGTAGVMGGLVLIGLAARILGPTSAISEEILAAERASTPSTLRPGEPPLDQVDDLDVYAQIAAGTEKSLGEPPLQFLLAANVAFNPAECAAVPKCLTAARASWQGPGSELTAKSWILVFSSQEESTQAAFELGQNPASLGEPPPPDWQVDTKVGSRFLFVAAAGVAEGADSEPQSRARTAATALAEASHDLLQARYYERDIG